LEGVCKTP